MLSLPLELCAPSPDDAFEEALKDAHPVYESGKSIANSHQGFDENGKVTDAEKARETVKVMGEKLREIKDAMDGTGKALRDAIRDFRKAVEFRLGPEEDDLHLAGLHHLSLINGRSMQRENALNPDTVGHLANRKRRF